MQRSELTLALAFLWLAGCGTLGPAVEPGVACGPATYQVDDAFDGARRGVCHVSEDGVVLTITPEDEGKINDSAWFAFRLTSESRARVNVTLDYVGGHHRYLPKVSLDGVSWRSLNAGDVQIQRRGRRAVFSVDVGRQPVYVAGQELILPGSDERWLADVGQRVGAVVETLGPSRLGHPIHVLETGRELPELVFLIGRQHPPEVSGSFGFKGFVEAVMDNTPLAVAFRERFGVVMVPMLNPDGVLAGHWRHNTDGQDLNRDWGPFTQPETRHVLARLDQQVEQGRTMRLFLDFHSTRRNVFYTQPDGDPSEPTDFALRWLNAATPALSNYIFEHARRHNAGLPTSKNYINQRFGIPAITYEVGDETNRTAALEAARVFAETMMRLLLAQSD